MSATGKTWFCLANLLWALALGMEDNRDRNPPWQVGPKRYFLDMPGMPHKCVSLYPGDGAVEAVIGRTLYQSLESSLEGEKWQFVEMYDHMCPHCWYAVPIVSRVAEAFKGVDNLKISSINCHLKVNHQACFFLETAADASDFPSFLLCPPKGTKVEKSPRQQRLASILRGQAGEMDSALSRCHLRYIEHAPHGKEDPFLSATELAQWITHTTGALPMKPEVLTQGADFQGSSVVPVDAPPGRPGWLMDDLPGAPGVPAWVPGQRWFDGLRGFVALAHQSYRVERHAAIVESADFLARSFPVKGRELRNLAQRLRDMGPQADHEVAKAQIAHWAVEAGIPDPDAAEQDEDNLRYTTCDGTMCAFWTLLHIALASIAVRGISGRPLVDDMSLFGTEADVNVIDHLPSIHSSMSFVRQFVDAFLNCGQCKKRFLEDFDDCRYGRNQVTDFEGLALWLWRAHNAVSLVAARQLGAEVDRRWPMYEDCPTCWRMSLVLGNETYKNARRLRVYEKEELDQPFHTERVFWHIVRTYVGLSRVRLEDSSLTALEKERQQALRLTDSRKEQQVVAQDGGLHTDFLKPPPPLQKVVKNGKNSDSERTFHLPPALGTPPPLSPDEILLPPPPALTDPGPFKAPHFVDPQQAPTLAPKGVATEIGLSKGTSALAEEESSGVRQGVAILLAIVIMVAAVAGMIYFVGMEESWDDGFARAPVLRREVMEEDGRLPEEEDLRSPDKEDEEVGEPRDKDEDVPDYDPGAE